MPIFSITRFLNVPKKMKHSVINICVSILLLIITFTMGVKRTDHVLACQIVGIILHYLTLVTMFWITVTARLVWYSIVHTFQVLCNFCNLSVINEKMLVEEGNVEAQ